VKELLPSPLVMIPSHPRFVLCIISAVFAHKKSYGTFSEIFNIYGVLARRLNLPVISASLFNEHILYLQNVGLVAVSKSQNALLKSKGGGPQGGKGPQGLKVAPASNSNYVISTTIAQESLSEMLMEEDDLHSIELITAANALMTTKN
jgi:hypothetical protein